MESQSNKPKPVKESQPTTKDELVHSKQGFTGSQIVYLVFASIWLVIKSIFVGPLTYTYFINAFPAPNRTFVGSPIPGIIQSTILFLLVVIYLILGLVSIISLIMKKKIGYKLRMAYYIMGSSFGLIFALLFGIASLLYSPADFKVVGGFMVFFILITFASIAANMVAGTFFMAAWKNKKHN